MIPQMTGALKTYNNIQLLITKTVHMAPGEVKSQGEIVMRLQHLQDFSLSTLFSLFLHPILPTPPYHQKNIITSASCMSIINY